MLWLAVIAGAGIGGFIQAITGFGSAVVIMTIYPYFLGVVGAGSLSNSICLGLSMIMSWRYWKEVSWKLIILPTILYDLASMVVISHLGEVDLHLLTIAFGVFLVLLSLYLLFVAKGAALHISLPASIVLCLFAGVCGGLFSIGGPMMAIYFIGATDSHESYLANMQTHFAINNAVSLATRVSSGLYTMNLLPLTLVGLVGVLLGEKTGVAVSNRFNAESMRRVVYAYVGVSGVITILQQLL